MADAQRVFPYLAYEDAAAAVDWLCRVFGFERVDVQVIPDGRVFMPRSRWRADR